LNPYSVNDMLLAHEVLMNELTKEAGMFRSGGVGIFNQGNDGIIGIKTQAIF
jgi:Fic family protein